MVFWGDLLEPFFDVPWFGFEIYMQFFSDGKMIDPLQYPNLFEWLGIFEHNSPTKISGHFWSPYFPYIHHHWNRLHQQLWNHFLVDVFGVCVFFTYDQFAPPTTCQPTTHAKLPRRVELDLQTSKQAILEVILCNSLGIPSRVYRERQFLMKEKSCFFPSKSLTMGMVGFKKTRNLRKNLQLD